MSESEGAAPPKPELSERVEKGMEMTAWFETKNGDWPDEEQAILAEIAYFIQAKPVTEIVACYAEGEDLKTIGGDDIGWTVEVIIRWIPLPTPPIAPDSMPSENMQDGFKPSIKESVNREMLEALKKIRDGVDSADPCGCEDHTDPDCCNNAGYSCSFCIAEAAISKAESAPQQQSLQAVGCRPVGANLAEGEVLLGQRGQNSGIPQGADRTRELVGDLITSPPLRNEPPAIESEPAGREGWIAVSERLPEYTDRDTYRNVLVWDSRWQTIYIAWRNDEGIWEPCCEREEGTVTHWRELPAPPVATPPADWLETEASKASEKL